MKVREHAVVVLTKDLPDAGLLKGGMGTVVHAHNDRTAEVEFMTERGRTIAVVTVDADALRAAAPEELGTSRTQ